MTSDLAAVVAKVLAAHQFDFRPSRGWACYGGDCNWKPVIVGDGRDENGVTMRAQHRAHVAAEVTNTLTTALTRPEVVEAAVRAVMVLENGSPDPSEREYALAALAVIPEALGAAEVEHE